jgi:hypothetical protein
MAKGTGSSETSVVRHDVHPVSSIAITQDTNWSFEYMKKSCARPAALSRLVARTLHA